MTCENVVKEKSNIEFTKLKVDLRKGLVKKHFRGTWCK